MPEGFQITEEQALELINHLFSEFNSNGFNEILNQVIGRFEEDYEQPLISPIEYLHFFLSQSIDVLECLSNNNFPHLITKYKEVITGNNLVESISVEMLNQGQIEYYNLKSLPDYISLVNSLKEIHKELLREN
ncbi:MAG: hypothetical protein WCO44_07095 [Bacteroidota bacterium]